MSRRKVMALREASGKVQRDPQLPAASEVQRLRAAALAGMRDPLWGTELGRLHLGGRLTAAQVAAGRQWAEYAGKYHHALCSPPPDPKAMCLDIARGRSDFDPESEEGRKEIRRHLRAVNSFTDSRVVLKDMPRAVEETVRSVCERNEMIAGWAYEDALSRGLSALADFWGLTGAGKSRHVR